MSGSNAGTDRHTMSREMGDDVMARGRLSLSLLLLLFLLPLRMEAQTFDHLRAYGQDRTRFTFDFPSAEPGGELLVQASFQEVVEGEYALLEGNVKIVYQDLTITADQITRNLRTEDITAVGNVVIDQGPQRISGSRMVFNIRSKLGTIFQASGSFDGSLFFTGESIEKIDERTYRLTNGVFTSCDIDDPAWSFHLASGTVTVDEYARLRNLSFRAGKVPVLWTPYLIWPVKRERSQGFLVPRIGASNRFGAYLGSAYFLPFGDSADATLYADYYSRGYHGGGTELRYIPSEDMRGDFQGYVVRDAENKSIEWRYEYQHTQENLPGGFRGVIDLRDFSSLDFFQRFSRDFNLNTISNIYSSAYLTRNSPRYAVNIRTDRREQFLGLTDSVVFEQIPSLEFRTYPNRVPNTPLYFSLESSTSHLRTSLGANYYRADLFPTISMQLRTAPWFSLKPQVSVRETYYSSSLDPITRQVTDEALSRTYAQGQLELVGPSFSRIFRRELAGFDRFKHVIEPRFRYVYTTGVDTAEQQRVIRFDTVDSPFLPIVRDTVEYSLTQRLMAREPGERTQAREIVTLALRQTVSLGEPFDDRQLLTQQRYTPINANLQIRPWQSVSFDANAAINHVTSRVETTSISTNLLGPEASFLSMTWFASFQQPGALGGAASQLRFSGGAPLWRDRIRGAAQINYDAERREILEQRYLIDTRASCYGIAVEFRDFQVFREGALQRNRDYHLSISLKNVGTFVDLRGSLDRN
jgi:LPS-assembly protein